MATKKTSCGTNKSTCAAKPKMKPEYLTAAQRQSLLKSYVAFKYKIQKLQTKTSGYSRTYLKEMEEKLNSVGHSMSYL